MGTIKKFIYSISSKGIREKKIKVYMSNEEKYMSMPEKEYSMEFIETCASYDCIKMIFIVILVFVLLTIRGIWSCVFDIIGLNLSLNSKDLFQLSEIAVMLSALITVIMILGIITLIRNIYLLNKKNWKTLRKKERYEIKRRKVYEKVNRKIWKEKSLRRNRYNHCIDHLIVCVPVH